MKRFTLAALFACALACRPAVRGQCNSSEQCRTGAYCSLDGICLAASGTCSPACKEGEICSGSTCAALKPAVAVKSPAGALSPAHPQVTIHVEAPAAVTLGALSVEVDAPNQAVASGTVNAVQAGDNVVALSNFAANAVGNVSVRASLGYQANGQSGEAHSLAVPATVDAAPPSITIFVPPAADAVNGWAPRNGGTLEVRATVDDGAGTGASGAALTLDACATGPSCVVALTSSAPAGTAVVYSWLVQRNFQIAGSEAPLTFKVTAQDAAGNSATAAGALQIDDAPPQVGSLALVSTSAVSGEDGNKWFPGGSGAPDVEIALPVTDRGAGVGAVSLQLFAGDLTNPPASLQVAGTPAPDGYHFLLPASAIRGAEQHLRFTLTVSDQLAGAAGVPAASHTATIGPNLSKTMIWVDALPPVVINGPRVDYAHPTGIDPQCGGTESSTYHCGRQGGTHLLADDTATVTFDAYDCGSGLGALPDATVRTAAGGDKPSPVTEKKPAGATQCTNGSSNKTHHYSFTLNAGTVTLDPSDATSPSVALGGTSVVGLIANAPDRLGFITHGGPSTSGDGAALVSLWRWKAQVANAQPSGSPALIPAASTPRQIAVGTTLPSSSPNLFVLNPDGTSAWSAQVTNLISGDVAASASGKLYVVSPAAASCSTACSGVLSVITASPGSPVAGCAAVSNVSFGSPPVLIDNPERAVLVSNAHTAVASSNVFVFTPACAREDNLVGVIGTDYGGASANWPSLFLATSPGFVEADRNGNDNGFSPATRPYDPAASAPAVAPPSFDRGASPNRAVFGSIAPDDSLHAAVATTCTGAPCWDGAAGFTPGLAASKLPWTPVFDAANLYVADDKGKLYVFVKGSGAPAWSIDFTAAPTASSGAIISPPVLLQGGVALVVRSDGMVALASPAGAVALVKMASLAAPVAPVVETRGTGGVAYVSDGDGFVWAVQVPDAPATPGASVWPRPGRDSCNSRNAASSCN